MFAQGMKRTCLENKQFHYKVNLNLTRDKTRIHQDRHTFTLVQRNGKYRLWTGPAPISSLPPESQLIGWLCAQGRTRTHSPGFYTDALTTALAPLICKCSEKGGREGGKEKEREREGGSEKEREREREEGRERKRNGEPESHPRRRD
ncbi:hypothetical protein L345_05595, partial [Ophiophagus hannah]